MLAPKDTNVYLVSTDVWSATGASVQCSLTTREWEQMGNVTNIDILLDINGIKVCFLLKRKKKKWVFEHDITSSSEVTTWSHSRPNLGIETEVQPLGLNVLAKQKGEKPAFFVAHVNSLTTDQVLTLEEETEQYPVLPQWIFSQY